MGTNCPAAHYNLGLALKQQGNLDDAIAAYREAIRLAPSDNAFNNLGNALSDQGKFDEAIAAYKEALRLQPDKAFAHNNLGNVFSEQQKFAEAIPYFREAIRLKPDYFTAYFNLSIASHQLGDSASTIRMFEEAVKKCRDDNSACEGGFFLAQIHWRVGNKVEARQWYEKTVERMEQMNPPRQDLRALRVRAAADLGIARLIGRQGSRLH